MVVSHLFLRLIYEYLVHLDAVCDTAHVCVSLFPLFHLPSLLTFVALASRAQCMRCPAQQLSAYSSHLCGVFFKWFVGERTVQHGPLGFYKAEYCCAVAKAILRRQSQSRFCLSRVALFMLLRIHKWVLSFHLILFLRNLLHSAIFDSIFSHTHRFVYSNG